MRQAVVSTAEGKKASAQIEAEYLARRNELEALGKQIANIKQRLYPGANVMKQEEQDRLAREGERLAQKYQRKQNEFQEDLSAAQTDAASAISSKLMRLLSDYAPKNGFSAVLDYSVPNSPVLYAATDITDDIVRLYDQTYLATSPSTAKPADK